MRRIAAASVGILLAAGSAAAVTVPLEYVGDITPLTTFCSPRAIKVSANGAADGALWGTLKLAGTEHAVRVAPRADGVELAIDLDGDGTTTPVAWERILADGALLASPEFVLAAPDNQTASYRAFVMWSPFLPIVVSYCRGSYRSGTFEAAGRSVTLALVDDDTDGTFDDEGGTLFVDVDVDGRLLTDADSHERFRLSEPFVVDGVTYVATSVATDGAWAEIEIAAEPADPKPPLLEGFPAPVFSAVDARGTAIDLEALRGKVVLLDFWAAWCAPCLNELSTVVAIHETFGERGVVVVGINLDRSHAAFDTALAQNGLLYAQVYDGPDGPVSSLYRIGGLPMTYLIDRGGVIRGRDLRGDALVAAVAALLDEESGP
jgi:thiol-disulfide isomerase/thioredoxin